MAQAPLACCASSIYHGVGEGLDVGGAVGAGGVLESICRAAVPKLLKIATPIPNWSSVIGPIDSAT